MNHDFEPLAPEPVASPLSAAARARKRELLPNLQREIVRRRARRRAAAGGLAASAAAAVVVMGVIATLGARPAPTPPIDRVASNDTSNRTETSPAATDRHEATWREDAERGTADHPDSGESGDAPAFRLVRNDPAALDRARIDDRRLVQELRSAGYQAGLVRTDRRVFLVSDQQ